jgi:hypothetical protein
LKRAGVVPIAFLSGVHVLTGSHCKFRPNTLQVVGWLHFGFCGPYEMQGPSMDWWKYPSLKSGKNYGKISAANHNETWFLDHEDGGDLDAANGITAHDHVVKVLIERWRGTLLVFKPEFCISLPPVLLGFTMLLGLKPSHLCNPIACLSSIPFVHPFTDDS